MFKGIKDKFKYNSSVKFLKQELAKDSPKIEREGGISSVGCIVDLDSFEDANLFYDFVEDYKLRPNGIKIIGYRGHDDKNSPYSTPVFSDKDLGWNGNIENSYAHEFLSREYDLLVNYYTTENLLIQLMSIKTRARFRVGFKDVDRVYNDLIIDAPLKDFTTFRKELKKYLGVLNEIR